MGYIRTPEIREKQRQKMLENAKTRDYSDSVRKAKETREKTGVRVGRKPGDGAKKTGCYKPCPVCGQDMWVTPRSTRQVCSRKCLYSYPPYIEKQRAIDKSYLKSYRKTKDPNFPAYRRYASDVRTLTEQNYINNIDTLNPDRLPRTLCGVPGGYQLDHIKSIKQCYNEGLTVEAAASVGNLQIIPWKSNLAKRTYGKIRSN